MPEITITIDTADYQDTLDAFAKAYGYQTETQSINEKDELVTVPNDQTPDDFFASRLDAFVSDVRWSYLVKKATDTARDAINAAEAAKTAARLGGKGVVIKGAPLKVG